MNQIIQELIFQADQADSLGKVKKSLKDIKGALLNVEEGSEAFHQLSNAAALLKDKVEDANAAIERANPDKFNGLASAAKIAATGIQLTTGAMALFGNESEDVQKALMKVQAAMMFAEGLQNVKELEKDFAKLGQTIAQNPIFLVATVLIAIGAAAYKMYQDYKQANSEAHKLKVIAEETKKVTEQQVLAGNNELAIMQAKGATAFDIHKKEKEILDIKIKNAEAQLAAANSALKELKNQDSIYETVLKIEASFFRKLGWTQKAQELEAKIAENQKERYGEQEKAAEDAQNQLDALKTEAIVSDLKYQKVVVENAKKSNDEKLKNEEEHLKKLQELREKNRRETTEKDLLALQDYQAEQAEFFINGIITAEEYNARIAKSNKDYADKKKSEEDAEWENLQAQAQKELEANQENLDKDYAQLKANNKKKADDDKRAAELKKQLNADALNNTANLFGSLAELSKKNAKVQKGLAIGQATINTFQGVTKALAAYPPPFSFLAAAAALAAGLVQVKNIIGTKEEGGGGSFSSSVGSSPNLDAISTQPQGTQPSTPLDVNGNILQQQNQQPQVIQAYMVESQAAGVHAQVQMVENAMKFQ